MKTLYSSHRQALARFWRRWEITRLPGFNWLGQPDKPLSAFCAVKPSRKYWSFRLEFDQLDTGCSLYYTFSHILETCGPPEYDLLAQLWNRYQDSFSHNASLSHGSWRWWSGCGLSRAFVDELRTLVVDRYAKAREVLLTYVPDPAWPGSLMPPGGWPKKNSSETRSQNPA